MRLLVALSKISESGYSAPITPIANEEAIKNIIHFKKVPIDVLYFAAKVHIIIKKIGLKAIETDKLRYNK